MWYLEGVDDLVDEDGACHKNAFYIILKQMHQFWDYTTVLLTKKKYNQICQFCMDLQDGIDAQAKVLQQNLHTYLWEKKCALLIVGKSAVLVLRPDAAVDVRNMNLSLVWQLTCAERIFADLLKIHKVYHCKGTMFFKQAKAAHGNVTLDVCKMFIDCCLHCVSLLLRKKPVAGIKNIITFGF
jgi:hypothetical protein